MSTNILSTSSSLQIHVSTNWNLRIFLSTNSFIYEFKLSTSSIIYKFVSLQIYQSTNLWVYEFMSLQICESTNFTVYKFTVYELPRLPIDNLPTRGNPIPLGLSCTGMLIIRGQRKKIGLSYAQEFTEIEDRLTMGPRN